MDEISILTQRITDSKNKEKDYYKNGFFVVKSKYYTLGQEVKGNKDRPVIELSNFVGKSIFNIENGTNNSKRMLLIQRNTGETHIIEVNSSEMKLETFEVILKSKQCTFFGNAYHLKKIFAYWMDNEQQAEYLSVLGWDAKNKLFAFSNGIFDTDGNEWFEADNLGIVTIRNKKYFLPAFSLSHINDSDYENERKFKYISGNLGFSEWAKLYYDAYGSNGAIAIQYLILSLFWDIVFNQAGFFPFLFLFGAYGTGKTALTESLLRVFGNDVIGTPINNTSQVGLSRTIAGRNNTIYYLKEYTQDSESSIYDLFLTAYDGAGRTTGIKTNDNKTKIAFVKSALMIDGNSLPTQKSAVLSRMILLYFQSNKFSKEQREAYNKLKEEQEKGLGKVILDILKLRETFAKDFKEIYEQNLNLTREITKNEFAERTIKHVALILTPIKILQKLNFPFSAEVLKKEAMENAFEQTKLLKQTDEVTIFWEAFAVNISRGSLFRFNKENNNASKLTSHFQLKLNAEQPILQIKIPLIFHEYVKYCKSINQQFLEMNSLRKLITSNSYKPFIPNTQKGRGEAYTDKNFGSCYQYFLDKKTDVNGNTSYSINDVEIPL